VAVKVTIIGAGSVVFSLALVKDVCLTEGLAGSHITFMDINAERNNVVHKLAERYAEDLGADLTFSSTLDREESLQDADFVVNTATITHNEYYMRDRREMLEKLGYYYGRVGMPEYHNLQLMLDVATDVARIAPDAWIIQAGNPVFAGTTMMHRETGVKVCGLCHGHYGYRTVATAIGLDPDKVTWQAPGLNHNIWLTHFYYEGKDAYPILDDWIANEAPAYWEQMESEGKTIPAQLSKSAVHQYKLFGLMPIGDTPRSGGWWYHTDLETRIRWYGGPMGGGDTPEGRQMILEGKEKKYAEMMRAALDPDVRPIEIFGSEPTREQHVPIIDGLVNDHEGLFQVNVPNYGALQGVPDDVAVEVPAIVNKMGIQPLHVTPLPKKILLEKILPVWLHMEQNLEALKSGDMSMQLWGILDSHGVRSYDHAVETLEALLALPETEPMAYIESVHDHYKWPDNWDLPS
jgi:alpha-galactosidase